MKFKRLDQQYASYDRWREICPEGTFTTVEPSALSGLVPSDLLSKTNSVFMMSSGSPQSTAFIANLNRVDEPVSAVDQEPYIVVFNHSGSTASGGFVHHGGWTGRTTHPGAEFFDLIAASGIQAYYPLTEMPPVASGYIGDLTVTSQKEAFWKSLSLLQDSNE